MNKITEEAIRLAEHKAAETGKPIYVYESVFGGQPVLYPYEKENNKEPIWVALPEEDL